MNVFDRALELIFRLVGRVVGELRFVGADQVRGGVDDGLVELEDRRRLIGDLSGEALELRVEPHADQRVVRAQAAGVVEVKVSCDPRARPEALLQVNQQHLTAAGVTPGTRPACPIVAGRNSMSGWRTSCESPAMAVVDVVGQRGSPRCGAGGRSPPAGARCSRHTSHGPPPARGPAPGFGRRAAWAIGRTGDFAQRFVADFRTP